MDHTEEYRVGLTYLVYLIISADSVIEESELDAMENIIKNEGISEEKYQLFLSEVRTKTERELYETGINLITKCTEDEKKRAFAWLYKMSEVDGHVHVKEVRFLLYSIKHAGIEFEEVAEFSEAPSIEELADIQEVVYGILSAYGWDKSELDECASLKRYTRGGFTAGLILDEVAG